MSRLEPITATSTSGIVATVMTPAPAVRVLNRRGRPMAAVDVVFQISDRYTVETSTVRADAAGIARLEGWSLGTKAGQQFVTASVGGSHVLFTVDVKPGAPARLEAMEEALAGVAGFTLDRPVIVRVVDQFGNGVPSVRVAFAVEDGGGTVESEATTEGDGKAHARWLLGAVGENVVRADVAGLQDVRVTATAREPLVFGSGVTYELVRVRTGSSEDTSAAGEIRFLANGQFESTYRDVAGSGTYTLTGAQSGIVFRYEDGEFLQAVLWYAPLSWEETGVIAQDTISIPRCFTEDCYPSLWTYRRQGSPKQE